MRTLHALALSLALAPALAAQSTRILAYPQDTTTFSSGNIVPLGSFPGNPNFEEGRWHELIPSTHLPTSSGVITGMSFICQTFTGVINYRTLRMTLSHTTATSLSPTFAANLPTPLLVLNQTNFNVSWVSRQWVQIMFDVPFPYNGKDNLVFEIQKEATPITSGIATMETDGNPGRSDLPPTQYFFGPVSSGAANAPTASFSVIPLQARLHWLRSPTLFLKSDRLTTGSQNVFAITGNIDINLDAGVGSQYVTFIDTAFTAPYFVPSFIGYGIVLPAGIFPLRTVAGPGYDTFSVTIPGVSAFIGVKLVMQALCIDPTIGGNVFFTNGTDFIIRTN